MSVYLRVSVNLRSGMVAQARMAILGKGMADIIQFRKPRASVKARGKTLCRSGFHKWVIAQDKQFDSQQGRLITVYRCSRCGVTKTKAH